jgi:hypothetical protein
MTSTTRVLLTRPHTHAGTTYAAGARIDVEAATATWLLAQGVAEVIATRSTPTAPAFEPKIIHRKDSKT